MTTPAPKRKSQMRDLLDYWNWLKTHRSRIVTLVLLAGLLVWMNVALWQAERNYRGVVHELRQNYHPGT
jgi:hypothetical protein